MAVYGGGYPASAVIHKKFRRLPRVSVDFLNIIKIAIILLVHNKNDGKQCQGDRCAYCKRKAENIYSNTLTKLLQRLHTI